MSKSFWGGMRIGWIRAEPGVLATIRAIRPSIDLGTSVVEQLAAAWLLTERADDVLPERREILRARRGPADRPARTSAAGMAAAAGHRRNVTVGATARPGQFGDVRLGVAARCGVAAGSPLRRRRHPWSGSSGFPTCCPKRSSPRAVELIARAWHSVTGSATRRPPPS